MSLHNVNDENLRSKELRSKTWARQRHFDYYNTHARTHPPTHYSWLWSNRDHSIWKSKSTRSLDRRVCWENWCNIYREKAKEKGGIEVRLVRVHRIEFFLYPNVEAGFIGDGSNWRRWRRTCEGIDYLYIIDHHVCGVNAFSFVGVGRIRSWETMRHHVIWIRTHFHTFVAYRASPDRAYLFIHINPHKKYIYIYFIIIWIVNSLTVIHNM